MLTVGTESSTAVASDPTQQYTYAFGSWSVTSGTVTSDMTVTATFTRTVNQYTVTVLSNDTDYGTVDVSSVTVDFGTEYSSAGNTLSVGTAAVTAAPAG